MPQGAVFASMGRQTPSLQHFPRSFELLTKQLFTLATFCATVFLSFTVAEKGAPPFVRYFSIFPPDHSRIAAHSLRSRLCELVDLWGLCVNSVSLFRLSTFNFRLSTPLRCYPPACPDSVGDLIGKSFPYPVISLPPCFLFLKFFRCNTYASPRKCCKQKTYGPS